MIADILNQYVCFQTYGAAPPGGDSLRIVCHPETALPQKDLRPRAWDLMKR
jgi:hypothetical protein